MQDRFKLRFWDKKEKEYFTCGDIDYKSGIFKTYPYITYNWCFGHKNIIVEQCTGLKDKNGKLIYEGDIVVDEFGDRMLVCWDNKYLQFCFQQDNGWYVHTNAEIEVIGNIHENADLLEIEE